MEQRAIIAAILSLLVLFLYQAYVAKQQKPQTAPPPPSAEGPPPAKEKPVQEKKEGAPVKARETRVQEAKIEKFVPEQAPAAMVEEEIPVDTPLVNAIFSTHGARLRSVKLKAFHQTLSPDSDLVDLVTAADPKSLPLEVSFLNSGTIVPPDAFYIPDKKGVVLRGGEKQALVFTSGKRIRIQKIFSFEADTYAIGLKVSMENRTRAPLQGTMLLRWIGAAGAQKSSYDYVGPVALVGGKLVNYTAKEGGTQEFSSDVRWAGFEDKYFIAAMIPKIPLQGVKFDSVSASLVHPLVVVPPRGVLSYSYELYLGPKELGRLKALQVDLDKAIDYGWFHSIAKPLLLVLKAFYSFSGNYGVAIILLTLVVRVVFFPLNQMSYRSMKEMQKLQPKIAELREKYKDDKDRLNRETMDMYRQHKVNPFGGCLPILIQIPVFIALYQALMKSIELRHAPFVWWIQDLSSPEVLFSLCVSPSFCIPARLLPLLMGVTTFIQQKMTPTTGDPQQAKMMLWFMPIMLTVFFWGLPSGLVLYWTVNNILSIAQQVYINRKADVEKSYGYPKQSQRNP